MAVWPDTSTVQSAKLEIPTTTATGMAFRVRMASSFFQDIPDDRAVNGTQPTTSPPQRPRALYIPKIPFSASGRLHALQARYSVAAERLRARKIRSSDREFDSHTVKDVGDLLVPVAQPGLREDGCRRPRSCRQPVRRWVRPRSFQRCAGSRSGTGSASCRDRPRPDSISPSVSRTLPPAASARSRSTAATASASRAAASSASRAASVAARSAARSTCASSRASAAARRSASSASVGGGVMTAQRTSMATDTAHSLTALARLGSRAHSGRMKPNHGPQKHAESEHRKHRTDDCHDRFSFERAATRSSARLRHPRR